MRDLETVALFRRLPELRGVVPWAPLGVWPTPVQHVQQRANAPKTLQPWGKSQISELWVKREDLSSPVYGGNKVRTVEAHAGWALANGKPMLWSTGAFGSNHATATLLHAPRVGLRGGALLFAQPASKTAHANLRAMAAAGGKIVPLLSPASLPWAILSRRWRGDHVMTPGGATPIGALGHVSAGLELAEQVEAGNLPAPRTIYLAVGSTCTSAGLLVGLHLAAKLGIGFGPGKAAVPQLRPVRVTPWPFTSTAAVLWLARWTNRRLGELLGRDNAVDPGCLAETVAVVGGYLGRGYGYPTTAGDEAITWMHDAGGPHLDSVYSGKSGAAMLAHAAATEGPCLFWATKSTAELPTPTDDQLAALPPRMRRWLNKTHV